MTKGGIPKHRNFHKTNRDRLDRKKCFCIGMEVWVPLDRGVNVPWEWQGVENINQLN